MRDLGVILGAALTLLALIIGFSFSMAVTRYDQRKNYEEAEANGMLQTRYSRGLASTAHALKVRELLREYVNQRALFYTTRSARQLDEINAFTARLQSGLWSAVQASALAQPTPVMALTVSGMNDVLNSQGYAQAAWWNRIPTGAWALMGVIAISSNLLLGYTSRRSVLRLNVVFSHSANGGVCLFLSHRRLGCSAWRSHSREPTESDQPLCLPSDALIRDLGLFR